MNEMNTPSDSLAGFLGAALALGVTYSRIAGAEYDAGNRLSADKLMATAQKAYDTVDRFLTASKSFKHLSAEAIQECRSESNRLRERLDGLQRFRN